MIRVFWDTNLFIYLIEGSGERNMRVKALLARMAERHDQLCTSTMTLGEVLVMPQRAGRADLVSAYESALTGPEVLLTPFDKACARLYSQIRQDQSIKPPDAIQLSCAAQAHCDLFITNDERLSRKNIPGIHFIVSLNRALL